VAALTILLASACGGGRSTASPEAPSVVPLAAKGAATGRALSVTLPAAAYGVVGTPLQLVAKVTDRNGKPVNGVALAWASADQAIATVDSAGLVNPLRAGRTAVTASAGGSVASTLLEVSEPILARSRFVGTNLSGIAYYATQFPFADMMKSGMGWISRDDSGAVGAPFPAMTADGYPAALNPGQHAISAVAWNDTHYPAGRYVILWEGEGAISFPMSTVSVAESSPNRIAIDVTDTTGQLWVSIDQTSAANPVRNLRFLWPGTEATFATQPFNPVFLGKIAPFSVLRFMDWGMTNGSPVVNWSDRPKVSDVTYANAGVPLEVMIDLANTLHADPWFCIPHQATDEYVRQFGALLHARLDPALRPHIEYSNEVWNTGFSQTTWAIGRSKALGLETPWGTPSLFYAQRSVEIFKILQQVYGPTDSARLVRVLSGQAVWTQFLEHALGFRDTAANADVMAIAPYFNAEQASKVENVDATLRLSSDKIVDQMLASIRGPVTSAIVSNAALAKAYNLKLKAYESGPGDLTWYFPADKVDAMTALFAAANRHPRMRDVYLEYYGLWSANGGDTMNQYNDVGPWSKWGNWGALEYVTQDPATAPKYRGLLDFIAAHPVAP
jgi:hypothetical protein